MTKLRLRRCALAGCIVLLIPPLVWTAVVLLAPTGWAKGHVLAALEAGTKRSVRFERLSMRWLGGVRLKNLEISAPGSRNNPWLKAPDLDFDIRLVDLVRGHIRPRMVAANAIELRVLRRADGTFEIADLARPDETPAGAPHLPRAVHPILVQIRGASITIVDEESQSRLRMQDVDGEGVLDDRKIVIPSMRGLINGGPFNLVGEFDRSGPEQRFEGRLRADDVVLDEGMRLIRYAVPVLAGAPLDLKGNMDTELYLEGRASKGNVVMQSLAGRGKIAIDPIDLDGAPFLAELSKAGALSRQRRIASIHSDFVIQDRRITTDRFTLNLGRAPVTLAGWTDFDGRIDYRLGFKGLTDRLPDEARRLLGELDIDLGSRANMQLRGNVNQVVVQLNGITIDRNGIRGPVIKREDREKLRSIGRKFIDQLAR